MKKRYVILAITLSAVLCACQQKTVRESQAESMDSSMEATEASAEDSGGAGTAFSEVPEQAVSEQAAVDLAETARTLEETASIPEIPSVSETGQPVEAEAASPSATEPASVPETETAAETDAPVPYGETASLSGYQLQDGAPAAIKASMKIDGVLRGEEAYAALLENDPQLPPPEEGKEYIVITVQVSYDEGEAEELRMYENIASLPSASQYFAMTGSYGNAENLTATLPDSIYNCVIKAGERAEGRAAFLHGTGENEPLIFAGFEQVVRFSLTS